jgi:anaerobic ribonucleoside-triphosphate reductase activating protein
MGINIAGFYEESTSNGKGWRSVLFISGCPHHCEGCHNPQTWDENYGEPFDPEYYLDIIKKNKIIEGVTLSGGEPLTVEHARELLPFVRKVKDLGLNIWVYSGFTHLELLLRGDYATREILNLSDVLVDGRYMKGLRDSSRPFVGSSNQRIIDLKEIKEMRVIRDEG